MSSEEEEYEVERILAKRGAKYHVKWKGWPLSDATWEPAAHLDGSAELIAEFEQAQSETKQTKTKTAKQNGRGKQRKPPAKNTKAAASPRKRTKKAGAAAAAVEGSAAASPTASPKASVQWFVEVTTYCSGCGCYAGAPPSLYPDSTTVSHGPYASNAEAEAAARQLRESEPGFEDWSDEHYGSRPPPYDSADGENYDEDEFVRIGLVSSAEREAAAAKVAAAAARELAKAAKSAQRPLPPMPPGGAVGHDPSLTVVQDLQLFARNPAPAVLGGVRSPASAFPNQGHGGFVHLMQRLSDMCYSVAAYCDDPTRGARYALKKYRALSKAVVWVPPPECGLGGSLAPTPDAVVDLVHTDIIEPSTGQARWTRDTLLAAVSTRTTYLFLNDVKARHTETLIEAIGKCGALKVVVFVECELTPSILSALASKATSLRGVHCWGCSMSGSTGSTSAQDPWVPLLSASTGLLWLGLDRCLSFSGRAWDAIPNTVRYLELECEGYGESLKSNLHALEGTMTRALHCMNELSYLMVNRQKNGTGCVTKTSAGGVKINVKIPKPVSWW